MTEPQYPDDLQGQAKRRYVADLFSRIAPRYDLMNTLMTGGMHHRWRKVAATKATQGLEGLALDVATGTGDLAVAIAKVPNIKGVMGLDLLPEMVTRAQTKSFSPSDHQGRLLIPQFMLGDGLSLPFCDNTFVCATSAWGLRNMPDLEGSLVEMVRVVKPGGRVVSLESMPLERGPLRPFIHLGLHHVVPLMGQLIGRDRAAYTYLPRSVDRFLTAQALARTFEEVGLKDVSYLRLGFGAVAVHWGTKT